jgi:hypothetical protein
VQGLAAGGIDPESWLLSSAFDLNPNPAPGSKELSTAIDFNNTQASIDTLMGVAGYFRLDAREAVNVLAQVTSSGAQHTERERALTIAKKHRE